MARRDSTSIEDALIRGLRGTVLEIGAGEGANFDTLPRDIEWIGLEPSSDDIPALTRQAALHGHTRAPLEATAEAIPLADESVDAVLSTLVLCSVSDPAKALDEIARVLRPGGSLVFVEHVAAPRGSLLRGVQNLATPLTRRFDRGCHLNRDTLGSIRASGLTLEDVHEYGVPSGLGFSVPFASGRAVKR